VPEAQLIVQVRNLGRGQINTLICVPDINNAYLLELAVIAQLPNLVSALLNNGADPCLTSNERGMTVFNQLIRLGQNAATRQVQQIIGLLAQAGGAAC
jgi:hypothetical protein